MKKLLAILLAVLMVLALGVTAFADDDTTMTQPADLTGHTYTAYQIFKGTQAADAAELGDIEWGDGIDGAGFLAALKKDATIGSVFASCTDAAGVAKAMENWADDATNAKAFAKIASNYIVASEGIAVEAGDDLDAGYYLVVDTTENSSVKNLSLLQLTQKGEFEIKNKVEVPKTDKELSDDNEGLTCTNTDKDHVHTKECYNWSKANQVALGDTVHFTIDSQVPESAADYDYYYFIVGDKLSTGLTLDKESIKVYIDGTLATKDTDYKLQYPESGNTFEVALIDAIAHAGETVNVSYDAVLNQNAVVGSSGNLNEATVIYSNDPNHIYDGKNEKPGFPADRTKEPFGETPKTLTLTFVTQIKVYKVDENEAPLNGAEFTLKGDTLNQVLVYKEEFTADEAGTFYKLKNGTYTVDPPVTADYMEAAEEGATKGYVYAEDDYEGEDKIEVGGKAYRPVKADETAAFILVKANASSYDSTETMYKMEKVLTTETANDKYEVVAEVDPNGEVIFTGLPAGTYTLSETKIPSGYNPIDPITFKVKCTLPTTITSGTETCTWAIETENSPVTYNSETNSFEVTIVNEHGSKLPETGGMGTTLFYIVGAVMITAAGILLITKKRMANED